MLCTRQQCTKFLNLPYVNADFKKLHPFQKIGILFYNTGLIIRSLVNYLWDVKVRVTRAHLLKYNSRLASFWKRVNDDFGGSAFHQRVAGTLIGEFSLVDQSSVTGYQVGALDTVRQIEMRSKVQFCAENLFAKTALKIFGLFVNSNGMRSSTNQT